jgi:ribosomal protein S15P/S13E
MPRHNIETLTEDLQKLRTSFQSHKRDVNKRFDSMQPQIQEMHDFVVDQKGFERGQSRLDKGAALSISPDIMKLIFLLATIIAALVGASKVSG